LADPDWKGQRFAASLLAFWSAEAARRQGKDAFRRYHLVLLRERHQRGSPLDQTGTLLGAAEAAGLDIAKFEQALGDATCLERLARDHAVAVDLGVFGTPTFVFPGARPVYLKLDRLLTAEQSLEFWRVFHSTAVERPYVLEMKRPH
jgi:2-hydroxychromene-2-carboxylate isomerase